MAPKPVDPYAAAATPVSSTYKQAQAAARRRRKELEERRRVREAAERRRSAKREREDIEILAADRTITIGDVAATAGKKPKKKPTSGFQAIEQLIRGATQKPMTPRQADELHQIRLRMARGKPVSEAARRFVRDTRPTDLSPLFPGQPGKTVEMRRPGESKTEFEARVKRETPTIETVQAAQTGDKAAQQKLARHRAAHPELYTETSGFSWSRAFDMPIAIAGDIETVARGAVPAAKVLGGALREDLSPFRGKRDAPDADDLRDWVELSKWVAGDKNDMRKMPQSDSALLNLFAESMKQWHHGIRRAVPKPWDVDDLQDARKYWTEDPVFAFLDVFPFAAALTRPASVAKIAAQISKAQDVSIPRAVGRATRESYRPGAEARKGREGGIKPRVARANIQGEIVEAMGRPWSRSPIVRGMQRGYDSWIEANPNRAAHRVARLQERAGRETERRVKLDTTQLAADISDFTFSRLGRMKAVFGPRGNMTPAERARGTALMYAFQLDKDLPLDKGLRAVQQDKVDILESGRIDLPGGKTGKLTSANKQDLSREISDIENFLKELADDPDLGDDMTAALEAMKEIADRMEGDGLDIMGKVLGDDALPEIEARWGTRKQMLMNRLRGRGILGHIDSPERNSWMEEWTRRLGAGEARALMAFSDSMATRAMPDDPAQWYKDRVGRYEEMTADEFTGEGFFQAGRRQILGEEAGDFYSPLQHGLSSPKIPNRQTAAQWKSDIEKLTKSAEIYNSGIIKWLDSLDDNTRVYKSEVMEHLSSYLNNYNFEEYHFVNGAGEIDGIDFGTRWDDIEMAGSLVSRNGAPGEYQEIVMRLPGTRGRDLIYRGKGEYHWGQGEGFPRGMPDADNVVVHMRFYIFDTDSVTDYTGTAIEWLRDKQVENANVIDWMRRHGSDQREIDHMVAQNVQIGDRIRAYEELPEDLTSYYERTGIKKKVLLVEEIQSDWASQVRTQRKEHQDLGGTGSGYGGENMTDEDWAARGRAMDQIKDMQDKWDEVDDEIFSLEEEILQNNMAPDVPEKKAQIEELDRVLQQLGREINSLSRDAKVNLGIPPAPLKDDYYRIAIRRLASEAVDQDVDEIMFISPRAQHARNDEHGVRLDPRKTPAEHTFAVPETSFRMYVKDFPDFFAKEYGVPKELRPDAYDGYYATQYGTRSKVGPMEAAVLPINDAVRAKVARAQAMYQKVPNYDTLPRGATELLADGKTAIRIFERGDPSTWIHELGHVALHDLSPDDLAVIEKTLAGDRRLADWTKGDHERFARAFETYVRKGYAPIKSLQSVFSKLKKMIGDIWALTGQKSERIPAEAKAVFDDMFALPGTAGEPWGYLPHREFWDLAQSQYRGGVRPPAGGEVMGVPRLTNKAVERRPNEMVLYQTGRLSPDPAQLLDTYLNRLRYQATMEAREDVFAKGVPLSEVPRGQEAGGWLVRNPRKPPTRIAPESRERVRRGSDVMEEALEIDEPSLPDESMFTGKYEDFLNEFMAKVEDKPVWRDEPDVRWVPGDYVNTRFGAVFESAPRGKGWSALGMLNSLQRTAGIYGKPLAYVAGNVPFNVLAMLTSQPMSLFVDLPRAIRMRTGNKQARRRYQRLASEAGETRAGSGLPQFYTRATNKWQRAEERATGVQKGVADVLSEVADDPFRVAQLLRGARRMGHKTDKQLDELLDADTPQLKQDLHDARQITREQMLDFDALNPAQRQLASRVLYLWPFIYAATKWPLMYAREYPVRAGMASQLMQEEGEKKGEMPQQLANLIKTRFGDIDVATINPLSPIADIAEGTQALLKDPSRLDLSVIEDRLAPTLGALVASLGGGAKDLPKNLLRSTVPGASEVAGAADIAMRGSKIYGPERDLLDYLLARHIRFWPRNVNEQVIEERIDQFRTDRATVATFDREKADDWKKIKNYAGKIGGYDDDDIAEVRRSFESWWSYQEAVEQKKDDTGQRKLTQVQTVEILDEIVRDKYPEYEDELWDVNKMQAPGYEEKYSVELDSYITRLKYAINAGRSMVFNDYRSHTADD